MRLPRHPQLQILNPIVRLDPVFVMDSFIVFQGPPQVCFHDQPVLQLSLPFTLNPFVDVAVGGDVRPPYPDMLLGGSPSFESLPMCSAQAMTRYLIGASINAASGFLRMANPTLATLFVVVSSRHNQQLYQDVP